ncbi:MAG: CBS domain-containing protein, partial [Pirellulaceae bacterium]|nr:CBS domain-containing protein [Pirellulaceae bacterium]
MEVSMAGAVVEANLNDPVSRHMRTDIARVHVDHTVGQTLAELRRRPPPARIVYFYVVDDEMRLKGVIPTRALLLSPPETKIADIMLPHVIAVPADATVLEACEF